MNFKLTPQGKEAMLKDAVLRDEAFDWILNASRGEISTNKELYAFIKRHHPSQGARSNWDNRCKRAVRWAVQRAKRRDLIAPTANRGEWKRS